MTSPTKPDAQGSEALDGERTSFSHRVIFVPLALSVAAALLLSYGLYERYVRFEPLAARHLPARASVAVRFDVEQAVVYEPFRRHILALFEMDRDGRETRTKHLERKTTVELGVDMREFVFGFDQSGHWALAVAGLFRSDGVLDGVSRMLEDEGVTMTLGKSPPHLTHASGLAFAVAEDGTWILASDLTVLRDAYLSKEPKVRFVKGAAMSFVALPAVQECCAQDFLGGTVTAFPGVEFPVTVELEVTGKGWTKERAQLLLRGQTGDFMLVRGAKLDVDAPRGGNIHADGMLSAEQFEDSVKKVAAEIRAVLR